MKYALIGCGRISSNHIMAAKNNQLEIVALCDLDPGKITASIEKFDLSPEVKQYTDYREMLSQTQPELVAIATESGKHAGIALDCIAAGVNLIIEKPIALSLQDADEIIRQADKMGVKVCACHQNRFNKSIQKIREAVEGRRFGRLFHGTAHIRWNRGPQYYAQSAWRGTWAQDGGVLMNQCIHNIDLLRWMLGDEIEEVMAYTDRLNHNYIEAEDLGLALVKFKNGAYGVIEGTSNVYPANLEETLYLFGEKGTIKAGGHSVNIIETWDFADGLDDSKRVIAQYHENPPNIYGFGHNPLYQDVIEAIVNDRPPYIDAAAGRRALELVLAIYKSAAAGETVKFPLQGCNSTDFEGRFVHDK